MEGQMRCFNCSADVDNTAISCPQCGTVLITSGAASGSRTATIDEAVAFLPSTILDTLKPLPTPVLFNKDVDTSAYDGLGTIAQPYRWGKFCGVTNILLGAGCLVAVFFNLDSMGVAAIYLVFGIVECVAGYGLYNKMRFALMLVYANAGLVTLSALIGVLAGNLSGLVSLGLMIPTTYYFYKRSDEFF
jgi:hypothetical protein